jgi:hypothetical protein
MSKKERDKRWRDTHKEHVAEYNKQYLLEHPNAARGWREEHKDGTLEYARANGKRLRDDLRATVFEHYGGAKCACCGESISIFLCIDHINGGGGRHRAFLKIRGGDHFYRWLRNNGYPAGYRVLCHNCNYAESRGGCPHKVGPDRLDEGAST